jgi:hypothetical protein
VRDGTALSRKGKIPVGPPAPFSVMPLELCLRAVASILLKAAARVPGDFVVGTGPPAGGASSMAANVLESVDVVDRTIVVASIVVELGEGLGDIRYHYRRGMGRSGGAPDEW